MAQVVIASRLSDGLVVFLKVAAGGGSAEWVLRLAAADLARDDARAAALLAIGEAEARQQHTIVDPYLIEVEERDGALRPTKYREAIRCFGPSVSQDLNKAPEGLEA